jgi:hypothetical protein
VLCILFSKRCYQNQCFRLCIEHYTIFDVIAAGTIRFIVFRVVPPDNLKNTCKSSSLIKEAAIFSETLTIMRNRVNSVGIARS